MEKDSTTSITGVSAEGTVKSRYLSSISAAGRFLGQKVVRRLGFWLLLLLRIVVHCDSKPMAACITRSLR